MVKIQENLSGIVRSTVVKLGNGHLCKRQINYFYPLEVNEEEDTTTKEDVSILEEGMIQQRQDQELHLKRSFRNAKRLVKSKNSDEMVKGLPNRRSQCRKCD